MLYYANVSGIHRVSSTGEAIRFQPSPIERSFFLDTEYRPFLNRFGDHESPLTARDLIMVTREVASGRARGELDHDSSSGVDTDELIQFLQSEDVSVGDADLDGVFNSSDLVALFQLDYFETSAEADWSTGDFNGDRRFSTKDLVMAFVAGDFDRSSGPDVRTVPEPSTIGSVIIALSVILLHMGRIGRT